MSTLFPTVHFTDDTFDDTPKSMKKVRKLLDAKDCELDPYSFFQINRLLRTDENWVQLITPADLYVEEGRLEFRQAH